MMKRTAVTALCALLVFMLAALPGCGKKNAAGATDTSVSAVETEAVSASDAAPQPDADPTGVDTSASVDLNQYVQFVYSGTDGDGRVEVKLKLYELVEDMAPFIKDDNEYVKKMLSEGTSAADIAGMSLNAVDYTVEPDSGLSNGDKVTLKWTVDEAALAEFCFCRFLHADFVQEVGGFAAKGE